MATLAPVVPFKRAVHRHAYVEDAGQCCKAVFKLAIERGHAVNGVSGTFWTEVQYITIRCGDAEFLIFEIGKRLRHKDGACKQNHRQRRLEDDQGFLGKRRAVARGAIDAAQNVGRLRMGRQPRRTYSEKDAGEQRDQKCKSKNWQRGGCRRWACFLHWGMRA